jgi:hypothetical protein
MKLSTPSPTHNPEERLEAWLASQPLTPAPDFVERTLARIRAEGMLVSSAKAGNATAIDALIDRWLSEQPFDPDYEPAQLATQTRRTAEYEEREESKRKTGKPKWVVPFPAWARSAVAVAAAACVAFAAYFSNTNQVAAPTATSPKLAKNNVSPDTADDSSLPAYYASASDSRAILKLSDSLSDGDALLNSDDLNTLLGNDVPAEDDAVN